jgi:NADH dehydrogenase FAD-containing subunit
MLNPENILVPIFLKCKQWYYTYKNRYINKQNVVLLGQGWFAKGFMEHIDKSQYRITNIYRHDFVNTPMLLKTIKQDQASESNTNNRTSKFVNLIDNKIKDDIKEIDIKNEIVITNKEKISWKNGYLVCGLGSHTDIGNFWTNKINELRQLPNNQKICIVGAGPTGTELAFYLNDLKHNITIYDGLPDVYTYLTLDGKKHILDRFKCFNINLFTNKMFSETDRKSFDHVVFAVGSRPNDLTSKWKLTPYLNLEGHSNIYSGGDGRSMQPSTSGRSIEAKLQLQPSTSGRSMQPNGLPRNAQVAYEQGKYIALRLNSKENNKEFEFENKGIAIYTGLNRYYVELVLLGKTNYLGMKLGINGKIYSNRIPDKLMDIYYNLFK